MVFKKNDLKTTEAAKKGAKRKIELYGSNFTKLWQNPEWGKRSAERSRERLNKYRASLTKEELIQQCRKAGKNSRKYEKEIVETRLKNKFDFIFYPTHVCDRIAIKDNTIHFIEIKKDKHEKLKPKQKEFQSICKRIGIPYLIERYLN